MKKTEFKVTGMHCPGCEMNLQDFVSEVKGVKNAKADHKKGVLTVEYEERNGIIDEIKAKVTEAGYKNS